MQNLGVCQNPSPNLSDFNLKRISFLRESLDDSSRTLIFVPLKALETFSVNSQNVSLEEPRLSLSFCLVCLQFSLDVWNWRSIETSCKTWEKHQRTAHTHALCFVLLFWQQQRQQQQQQQKHLCSFSFRIWTHQTFRLLPPTLPPPFPLPSFINTREWGHASHLDLPWNPSVNAQGRGRKLLLRQGCLTFHACCHGDEIQRVDLSAGRFVCVRWSVQ